MLGGDPLCDGGLGGSGGFRNLGGGGGGYPVWGPCKGDSTLSMGYLGYPYFGKYPKEEGGGGIIGAVVSAEST